MTLDALRSLQKQEPCDFCRDGTATHEAGCEKNQFQFVAREHIVPIAEALELLLSIRKPDVPPNPRDALAEKAAEALKALQDALDA